MLKSTFLYKANGDLLVYGHNGYGQLGLGDEIDRTVPTLLMNNRYINIMSCSGDHSMIYIYSESNLDSINKNMNGSLLAFGDNQFGQLGFPTSVHNRKSSTPTLLMKDNEIKTITCGYDHSILYKYNGDVFVFGNNSYGQLGLGDDIDRYKPTLLVNNKEIKTISCGGYYSIIYENTGNLFVFGCNNDGQLGLGDNICRLVPTLLMHNNNINMICCGYKHTMNVFIQNLMY